MRIHKYSKCDASSLDYYTTVLGHNMVKQGDNSEYTDKADGFYSIVTCRCSMCDKTEEKKSFVRRWDNFDSELIAQHICNYAISKYGCTRDTSLNLGNGSYFACQDTRDHSEADIAAQSY